MLKKELDRAIGQSTQRLHKVAVPPVKYWLQRYVEMKDEEDSDVQRTLKEAKEYPPRLKLLKDLREDGTWQISKQRKMAEDAGPGQPYGWTYITMLRNLYWLYECCTDPDEGHVQQALDKILSWQDDEGYIRGPTADTFPKPHYNGMALSILLRYGRKRTDSRVRRIIDWLMQMQRSDGGWTLPYIEDMKYLPEYKHMKLDGFTELVRSGKARKYDPADYGDIPSCPWTTLGVLRGLAWIEDNPRIADVKRGGSFVLDGFFKRNYHATFYYSEKNWTILKFPTYFGSGLTALDSLLYTGFGPNEPRMEKPIRWLLGARSKDGFWYQTERPHALNDQWITVTALTVLAHYSSKF
ncbi:MAG: hypothetical protein WBC49_03915 [Thermoplasmata archaeon]